MTHPTNEKAPGAINTEGFENNTTNNPDFAIGRHLSKALALSDGAGAMKAFVQTLACFLVQAAPYAVAIVFGFALRGCQ